MHVQSQVKIENVGRFPTLKRQLQPFSARLEHSRNSYRLTTLNLNSCYSEESVITTCLFLHVPSELYKSVGVVSCQNEYSVFQS